MISWVVDGGEAWQVGALLTWTEAASRGPERVFRAGPQWGVYISRRKIIKEANKKSKAAAARQQRLQAKGFAGELEMSGRQLGFPMHAGTQLPSPLAAPFLPRS
jgi:hypothetical protein